MDKEKPFADGIIDEENPIIVDAIKRMIRDGYSDQKIKQVVGATQAMVNHHRRVIREVQ